MSLSVCIIARNEAQRIGDAIGSVRGVADEVVVLDTGSTDETPRLAESLGARVARFEWCDDFAAARNACQTHAGCDWLLWLDADERLKPGAEGELRRAVADPGVGAYLVVREDFFAEGRPDWFSEMYQLRLVRRDLGCRWIGRIHEHLDPPAHEAAARSGRRAAPSNVRLQHWGYTSERMPEKLRRAARLCEMELRDRPGQFYYLVEWSRSLLALNDAAGHAALGAACEIMRRHADRAAPPSAIASSLIEQLLAMPGQAHFDQDELMRLARAWFPSNAPLAWAAARTYSIRADWPRAEAELRRLLRLLETASHDRIMSFDPRVGEDARINPSVALIRQGKVDDAEAVLRPLLASPRRAAEARANLDAIADLRRRFSE